MPMDSIAAAHTLKLGSPVVDSIPKTIPLIMLLLLPPVLLVVARLRLVMMLARKQLLLMLLAVVVVVCPTTATLSSHWKSLHLQDSLEL